MASGSIDLDLARIRGRERFPEGGSIVKLKLVSCWVVIFAFSLTLSSFAGEWLDEFDKGDLDEAWFRITDLPAEQGSVTIEDGKLLLNEPSGSFLIRR